MASGGDEGVEAGASGGSGSKHSLAPRTLDEISERRRQRPPSFLAGETGRNGSSAGGRSWRPSSTRRITRTSAPWRSPFGDGELNILIITGKRAINLLAKSLGRRRATIINKVYNFCTGPVFLADASCACPAPHSWAAGYERALLTTHWSAADLKREKPGEQKSPLPTRSLLWSQSR